MFNSRRSDFVMKNKKIVIQINKPIDEVFSFTLNPKNTPLWVDSVVFEETNEWPVKKGSIYRNKNKKEEWSIYKVTSFEKNKSFVFSQNDQNYHVRYTFNPLPNNFCQVEYYEWVEKGNLTKPFTKKILKKLKKILEDQSK